MAHWQLRVYDEPASKREARPAPEGVVHQGDRVTMTLAHIFPLLVDAVRNERTWLQDFEDDHISISADFYDVLLAYQHFRPSA